jgi:hypothetical protein
MAKPYDATAKELLERDPESWLKYIGVAAEGSVRAIDADLSTLTAEADKVFCVECPQPYLVHLEIQARPDLTMPVACCVTTPCSTCDTTFAC